MTEISQLYSHPAEYDFETSGRCGRQFYVSMVQRLRPRRVLELGCGTGRITLPLAEQGARLGVEIVGLEKQAEMLERAAKRQRHAAPEVHERLRLVNAECEPGSREESAFDLIIIPCSSIGRLFTLEDQLAVWKAMVSP